MRVRCMLTFDEGVELAVGDVVGLQVSLQRQQQGEEELVTLIQPPGSVAVHLEGAIQELSHEKGVRE